jgi:lysophospholipase L1-like esterase
MVKRFSKSLAVTAAAMSVLAVSSVGTTTAAFADTAKAQGSLVALGDSITFGWNLDDTMNNSVPSQSAFPFVMGQDDHFNVTDLGVGGATSGDLVTALQTPNFASAIKGAKVITLDIGSNDLLGLASQMGLLTTAQQNPTTPINLTAQQQQQFADAITQFGKNLPLILTAIRQQNATASVVFFNLYDPFPSQATALHEVTETLQLSMNQVIAQLAATQKNVAVADAHKAFEGNQVAYVRVAQQDVHPTVLGQKALALTGEAALKPLLATNPAPTPTPTPAPTGSVPGATTPKTGLPFLTEGLAALLLLVMGGGLVAYSRRRQQSK